MPDHVKDATEQGEMETNIGGERVQREWLTPTEAMQYLGVSRATLYSLMDNGLLKFYTIKGVQKRRIRKDDLDALFEEGKTELAVKSSPKPKRKRKAK